MSNQNKLPMTEGRSLTPDTVVRLGFKDEDLDDEDRTIGPVFAYFQDGTKGRVQGGWFLRKTAERMAKDLGVPLHEL
jgi:hypothetical protein